MEAIINGLAVNYCKQGAANGLPVVFIHGFPFSHRMWKPQLAALPDTCRAVAYDVRGHGQSGIGDGLYSVEFFVDDFIALLDHLSIDRAVVCGLSMGGYIALRAAERAPERFRGLVLADTKSTADTNEAKINRAGAMRVVSARGVRRFAGTFVQGVFAPATFEQNPTVVEFIKDIICATDPLAIRGTLLALASRTDTTASLKDMNLPALILVGEHDALTTPDDARAMAAQLPQAQLHIIPQAAHISNLENPVEFNRRLLAFLEILATN